MDDSNRNPEKHDGNLSEYIEKSDDLRHRQKNTHTSSYAFKSEDKTLHTDTHNPSSHQHHHRHHAQDDPEMNLLLTQGRRERRSTRQDS